MADNIDIKYATFALLNDNRFPARVTVSLGVGAKDPELEGNVTNIQTTVSSRGF
jgi:hypothetical protein